MANERIINNKEKNEKNNYKRNGYAINRSIRTR